MSLPEPSATINKIKSWTEVSPNGTKIVKIVDKSNITNENDTFLQPQNTGEFNLNTTNDNQSSTAMISKAADNSTLKNYQGEFKSLNSSYAETSLNKSDNASISNETLPRSANLSGESLNKTLRFKMYCDFILF